MQIVLLFAILEPIFKFLSVQENSEISFFPSFLCSAKFIFLLERFFPPHSRMGISFLEAMSQLVYLYTSSNSEYNYDYQDTLNC